MNFKEFLMKYKDYIVCVYEKSEPYVYYPLAAIYPPIEMNEIFMELKAETWLNDLIVKHMLDYKVIEIREKENDKKEIGVLLKAVGNDS